MKTEGFMAGRVVLSVQGMNIEALVNRCTAAGVPIRRLRRVDGCTAEMETSQSCEQTVRELARRCFCDVTVLKRRGGREWTGLIKRRASLLFMLGAAVTGLLLSSLFIWRIEVVGNSALTDAEVLRCAAQCGVRIGAYWPDMDADDIRSRVLLAEDRLGWLGIAVRGSTATVQVLERTEPPEIYAESRPADVVAAKTGVVSSVSVQNGKSAVSRGETVIKGEVLISGTVDSLSRPDRTVHALGEVQADTWYELTSACPSTAEKKTPGAHKNRFALIVGKKRINFYISAGKTVDECDKIIYKHTLGLDGVFCLPITLVREKLTSYTLRQTERDGDTKAALHTCLHDTVNGKVESVYFSQSVSDGLIYTTARAHCIESIGETKYYTP